MYTSEMERSGLLEIAACRRRLWMYNGLLLTRVISLVRGALEMAFGSLVEGRGGGGETRGHYMRPNTIPLTSARRLKGATG